MIGQSRLRSGKRAGPRRTGFTLIEILVVMLIILLVSAVVLPTVIPVIAHRQVSEAARILQAALAGARDVALNNNAPAGIRLLPDPVLNGINPVANPPFTSQPDQLDPSLILASNRYVPIQLAPNYSEGLVLPALGANAGSLLFTATFPYQFPVPGTGAIYPVPTGGQVLILLESYYNASHALNPPTSWYWNIRIGDKIQVNNMGAPYTVVGPMTVPNPELFVNVGGPGTTPPLVQNTYNDGAPSPNYSPEFLFLVNGVDDNNDGYVDDGWDGVDNDGINGIDDAGEWLGAFRETETWQGSLIGAPPSLNGFPYTITRRPVVSPGSRETLLPSNVVVDLTTWNPDAYNNNAPYNTFGVTWVKERSRLPVDTTTGYVDVLLNPNGTVVPTTKFSSPSSFGMASSFYHFWLAERGDLFAPLAQANVPYLLPMVTGAANFPFRNPPNAGNDTSLRYLKGERRLITLYTRSGQMITNQLEDSSFNGNNPSLPFLLPQQGVTGDTR